jgi:hypothetical protein
VLLDSTSYKDSNEILFVIFGQVFYFLSILQDAVEIWELKFKFENHLTGLTGGADRPGRRGVALLADTISVEGSNPGRWIMI